MGMPIDRFLNLVYFWATEDAAEKDKTRFDVKLNMPDTRPGRLNADRPDSPWTKENEERALATLVGQLAGAARA